MIQFALGEELLSNMSIFDFLRRSRERREREELIRDLRNLGIDWDVFLVRVQKCQELLGLDVPCGLFRDCPCPESMVKTADELVRGRHPLTVEWFLLIQLTSVEEALSRAQNEARTSASSTPSQAYMLF